MPVRVLLVEGSRQYASSLKSVLEAAKHDVETVCDGRTGAACADAGVYDVLILSAAITGMDGFEVARRVRRKRCSTPILILADRDCAEERIAALDAGADFCLALPVDPRELLECINAAARRSAASRDGEALTAGNTVLDPSIRALICGGKVCSLTQRDCDVMRCLMQTGGGFVSRDDILGRVWGYSADVSTNLTEVYISRLRRHLSSVGSNLRIDNVRRCGYRLTVEDTAAGCC